jgi:hypothetical protein
MGFTIASHPDRRVQRMRDARWCRWLMVTPALLLSTTTGLYARGGDSDPPLSVSLCDVLAHPAVYSGKSLIVTVRITSTKEGASLWSPDCRKVGVSLHIESRLGQGIPELYRALNLHGLGDHPIMATLTGVFTTDDYDEFRHRQRSAFKATAATDIKRTRDVERR